MKPVGRTKLRRYHAVSPLAGPRLAPLRAVSGEKGTRTESVYFSGLSPVVVSSRSQLPLRQNHSGRMNWGRGYSPRGQSRDTDSPQTVLRRCNSVCFMAQLP